MMKTNKKIVIPKLPPQLSKKVLKQKAIKLYYNSTVYSAPFVLSDREFRLTLPPEIAKNIKLNPKNKTLYFVVTDGILQISANHPQACIPVLSLGEEKFIPQK